MNLLTIQRRMARAVMTPLTPSERMRSVGSDGRSMRAAASQIIKQNDRLTSFERLEIYNRQYWFRILSGFAEDYPGLRAVLGGNRFDAMAKAYLTDCPSQSFTLRNLGSRLDGWLRKHPRWAGPRQKLAVDMARLEWADIEAFDGKMETPLKPADLAGANPARLRLRLQPYVSLLALSYPVDDLLLEARKDAENLDVASNAFSEKHKLKRVATLARQKPSSIFLCVYRLNEDVFFRRLEREEFDILTALEGGKSLQVAIASALRKSSILIEDRAARVEKWFHTWSALGWFCQLEKIPQNKKAALQ